MMSIFSAKTLLLLLTYKVVASVVGFCTKTNTYLKTSVAICIILVCSILRKAAFTHFVDMYILSYNMPCVILTCT